MTRARIEKDFYETDRRVTRAFLARLAAAGHLVEREYILEPCVGDGAISGVLREAGHMVRTNDIDLARAADYHVDAADPDSWSGCLGCRHRGGAPRPPHWTISNPPFNRAPDIVPLAVEHSRVATAMLLRLSFMEPVANRRDFLGRRPPQHQIVTERIPFRKDTNGTDSVTTAWMIWTADGRPLAGIAGTETLLWKHLPLSLSSSPSDASR